MKITIYDQWVDTLIHDDCCEMVIVDWYDSDPEEESDDLAEMEDGGDTTITREVYRTRRIGQWRRSMPRVMIMTRRIVRIRILTSQILYIPHFGGK
jgi:hypothetical protein